MEKIATGIVFAAVFGLLVIVLGMVFHLVMGQGGLWSVIAGSSLIGFCIVSAVILTIVAWWRGEL